MRGTRRVAPVAAALALAAVALTACAAGPNPAAGTGADPAGFWLGLWHGLICPVTFLVSLFTDDVTVYEVRNGGGWYDLGFLLGASVVLGGSGAGGGRARRRGGRGGPR
ncbi:hypothetical protein [Kineococcus sp. SYSU DK004]|uniref:hypothetical protein n=1 Tax=Kineococcus sp. SYSU DK004 TaxID=3383125 RepID=UPI003D7C39E4